VRFFVSSLGNPRWIVDEVSPHGGLVFHDVTERKWADKAVEAGVHGLIAVNGRAGGHAGSRSPEELLDELSDYGLPVVCAGGVGDAQAYRHALELGYVGVQIGTRLIASTECTESAEYKQAIIDASENDIALTHKITGVPVCRLTSSFDTASSTAKHSFALSDNVQGPPNRPHHFVSRLLSSILRL
jgi:nitronate monooxygenase